MIKINFKHHYDKLNNLIFPTIRSPNYVKKHYLVKGRAVKIYIDNIHFGNAVFIDSEIKKLGDLSNYFLIYDGYSKGLPIFTRAEYYKLLDSFNRFSEIHPANDEMEKSILYFKKIPGNDSTLEDYF